MPYRIQCILQVRGAGDVMATASMSEAKKLLTR